MMSKLLICGTSIAAVFSCAGFLFFGLSSTVQAATQNWSFTATGDYTYDNTKIEISSGQAQLKAPSDWYNVSWTKRKPVTIDNTGNSSTLIGYQIKVSVTYDADMQADFDDIRFTDSDGTTLINYYLETKTDSVSAIYWVRVPSISASATKTIYIYYGNSGASSLSNGSETFEQGGFDDFESYDTGLLGERASALKPWSQYAGNPVLNTTSMDGFSSIFKDSDTYHMYYSWNTIRHATSSDGKNWTVDTAHNPVLTPTQAWEGSNVGVPTVWKEGATWYMLYRGGSPIKIGLATSSDGISWTKEATNPVLSGTVGQWDDTSLDPAGIIKVDSVYYLWYSTIVGNRSVGLATSTDLIHWTKDANNPIFTGGRFGASPFKYGDYYYILTSHYTYGTDFSQIELYRDTNPTFYSSSREFVRTAIQFGSNGTWNDQDQDTPSVLTDDIYRNSFNLTNNQLWTYFAGSPDGSVAFYTGLAIETDIGSALEKVNESPSPDASSLFWNGSGLGDVATVVDTPTRSGNRAIKEPDTSSSYSANFYTSSFGSKTTGAIGAWMRRSDANSSIGPDIYLYSGTTLATVAGFGTTYFNYWNGSFHDTAPR